MHSSGTNVDSTHEGRREGRRRPHPREREKGTEDGQFQILPMSGRHLGALAGAASPLSLSSPPPLILTRSWVSGFSLIKGSAEVTSLNFANQSDQSHRRIYKFFSESGRSFPLLSDRKFRVGRKRLVLGHQVGRDRDRGAEKGEFDSNRKGVGRGPPERANYLIAAWRTRYLRRNMSKVPAGRISEWSPGRRGGEDNCDRGRERAPL